VAAVSKRDLDPAKGRRCLVPLIVSSQEHSVERSADSGHRDYSHRSTVDKLGIREGHAVSFVNEAWKIDDELRRDVLARTGRPPAREDEPVDIALISADSETDVVSALREWRRRIRPEGGIWVLTPKRGQPGYVNQSDLIPDGLEAGLVDNKTCSASGTISGIRFVIRVKDRAA